MKQSQGFTLLEVLVAVAILAILALVAAPSFTESLQRARIDSTANAMRSALSEARSEAAFKRLSVTICVRNEAGDACEPRSMNWHQGWIIFIDHNSDGLTDVSREAPSGCDNPDDDCILVVQAPLHPAVTLIGDAGRFTFTNIGTAATPALRIEQRVQGCGLGGLRTISTTTLGRVGVTQGDCKIQQEASNG